MNAHKRFRRPLAIELLEARQVLSNYTVHLTGTLDELGNQINTIQTYDTANRGTFGILDTGSSVVSFSPDDQATYRSMGIPIPIKVTGGAQAQGIGGVITGDVSKPGTILADGIHASKLTWDSQGFPNYSFNFGPNVASSAGVQTFIGTYNGSPNLPSITGMPIFNPGANQTNGQAALISWQGYQMNLGQGIGDIPAPDVKFVAPGHPLYRLTGDSPVMTIALGTYGTDNSQHPYGNVTASKNPVDQHVTVNDNGHVLANQQFLLDTGAQLTVISTFVAKTLGLDLNNPPLSLTVGGVGGSTVVIPGFFLKAITLPLTNGNTLTFTNVPAFVLDVAPGIKGILGTNLWNLADRMVFDPFNAGGSRLSVTFYTDPNKDSGGGLGSLFSVFSQLPGLNSITHPFLGRMNIPGIHFTLADLLGQVGIDLTSQSTVAIGLAQARAEQFRSVVSTPIVGTTISAHLSSGSATNVLTGEIAHPLSTTITPLSSGGDSMIQQSVGQTDESAQPVDQATPPQAELPPQSQAAAIDSWLKSDDLNPSGAFDAAIFQNTGLVTSQDDQVAGDYRSNPEIAAAVLLAVFAAGEMRDRRSSRENKLCGLAV